MAAPMRPLPATLFRDCSALREFTLLGCVFAAPLPASLFRSCPALEQFTLMGCRFSESAPLPADLFRGCTALKGVLLDMLSVDHPSCYCGDEAVNPVKEVLRSGFRGWPMYALKWTRAPTPGPYGMLDLALRGMTPHVPWCVSNCMKLLVSRADLALAEREAELTQEAATHAPGRLRRPHR